MNKTLLIANLKMNGTLQSLTALVQEYIAKATSIENEVVLAPPYLYISQLKALDKHNKLGWAAQNCASTQEGAYTGEIAATMLADLNLHYVILGHSERRSYFKETNDVVAAKANLAIEAGLIPVICVGEDISEYNNNQGAAVVVKQLKEILTLLAPAPNGLVIAYEPVWAIGSNKSASADYITKIHAIIKDCVINNHQHGHLTRLLYGGSLKQANAQEILSCPNVDGGLIGGAALKASEFIGICEIGRQLNDKL